MADEHRAGSRRRGALRRLTLSLLGAVVVLLAASVNAQAQDLSAELANAEAQAAEAESEIASAEEQVISAGQPYAPIAAQARRADSAADTAFDDVQRIEDELVDRRAAAADRVSRLEAKHTAEVSDNDRQTEEGIGFALASLAIAVIVLAWGWFRASGPVAWLADRSIGAALGICVAGGVVVVVIGAFPFESSGAARVAGAFLVGIGLGLPIAFFLARHSAQVQRGRERALFNRERLPRAVAVIVGLLLLLLFAGGLGDALISSDPEVPKVAPKTRQLAAAAKDNPADPATASLRKAQAVYEPLRERADLLDEARNEVEQALAKARSQLRGAQRKLVRAQRDARYYTRRIAVIAAREARQAAAAAEAAAPVIPEPSAPSYSSCATAPSDIPVPPGSPLDGDGDGIGCES